MGLPAVEDAYLEAQRDPAFRDRFARAYDGPGDPLVVLERVATHAREDRLVAAALYGPHPAAQVDAAAAAALERDRIDRARIIAAVARAAAPLPAPPAAGVPRVARTTAPVAAPSAPLRGRRVPLLAVLAAAAALLPVAYLAGSSSTGSAAAARPDLPATLLLDHEGGGERGRVAYFAPSDQRGGDVVLGPVRGGYLVTTACLASSRRPRVLPHEGILLVDSTGVQIGRWSSPCDGRKRAFPVEPAVGTTQHAQLLLDLDGRQVKAAWAAVRPRD